MKFQSITKVVLLALALSIAVFPAGCGGKKKPNPTLSPIPHNGRIPIQKLPSTTVEDQLAELDELLPPPGVNAAVFDQLKDALASALSSRRTSKIVLTPPTGASNRAKNLRLLQKEDGSYALRWNYTNVGDYNQDGNVTIADITPLAEHFFKTKSGGVWEDPVEEAIDGNGDGIINISDITPLAENFFNNCSGYVIEGSDAFLLSWTEIDRVNYDEATGPGVLSFNFDMSSLDGYETFRVVPFDNQGALGEPSDDTRNAYSLTVQGMVEWSTGGGVDGANVTVRPDNGLSSNYATTSPDGSFEVPVAPVMYPVRILAEVSVTEPDTGLNITGFKWTDPLEDAMPLPPMTITLTDPVGNELTVGGGQAQSDDGSILIGNLDGSISRVFAESYDPDENPEAFPGSFEEQGLFSLNSSVFLWVTATDTSGYQVNYLSTPADMRVEIPQTQWRDLTDIRPGTGRIDVPIYDMNYATGMWEARDDGWLVDESGAIIPEGMEETITSGAYSGRIYAAFSADHFSYWNVDYPYIYVWTLSRLSREKRNNECLYKALKLSETIAKSQKGKDAYAKVNKPNQTIDSEYFTNSNPDNAGKKAPELKTNDSMDWEKAQEDGSITTTNGEYRGRVSGHRQDEFFINGNMWNLCTETSTELQKKQAIILMASTILHEFSHQKQHVKKGEQETVEVGKRLEKDLFGGDIHYWSDTGLVLDGNPVTEAQIDTWLNSNSWPSGGGGGSSLREVSQVGESGLEISVSTDYTLYNTVQSIYLSVTLRNGGSNPIQVLPSLLGMHYPVYIEVLDETQTPVEWLGPIADIGIHPDSFKVLAPGEEVSSLFDLRYDELANRFRFDLFEPGTYTVKVVYSEYLPPFDPVESNTATFTVEQGPTGSINGTVSGPASVEGITVYLGSIGGLVMQTATNVDGFYEFTGVPQGSYVLGFAGSGYASKMAVATVTPPDATTVDVTLDASADVPTLTPVFDIPEPMVDQAVGTVNFSGSLTNFNGSQIARALNGSFSLVPFSYSGGNYGTFNDLVILTTGDNGIRFYSANELGFSVSEQFVVTWQPIGTIHFRATLTWDRRGDMDLHVQDPNAEHSYYRNKAIGTGFLDVDNTSAYGPENFTAITYFQDDQVVPGTYHVWVNYFSGSEPTNCTITLRANIGTVDEEVVTTGPYLLESGDWYAIDVNVDANGFVTWTIPGTPPA